MQLASQKAMLSQNTMFATPAGDKLIHISSLPRFEARILRILVESQASGSRNKIDDL